jgi:hypothetical protein
MKLTTGLTIVVFGVLFSSCATRTKYQSYGESGGYVDGKYNDGTRYSKFAGNAYTHKQDAQLFSLFRAIEVCYNTGYKYTRILGTRDQSSTQDVQRSATNNYTAPTYYSGTANSNSNINYLGNGYANVNTQSNYNGTVYGGTQTSNTTSWTETMVFPLFETAFVCVDSLFLTKIKMRELKEDDVKPYVKDLRGALQVEEITDDSPNNGKIKNSDIILRLNGDRVWNVADFVKIVNGSSDKDKLKFDIVRDGKRMQILGKAVDESDSLAADEHKIKAGACGIEEFKERMLCQLQRRN